MSWARPVDKTGRARGSAKRHLRLPRKLAMTTLFDFSRTIKVPSFGRGILPSRPAVRMPFTAADADWASRVLNGVGPDSDSDVDEDARLDALADEDAFLDRYVRGHVL